MKICICMPYWNRAKALLSTLHNLYQVYREDLDLTIAIADDGSDREGENIVHLMDTGQIKEVCPYPIHFAWADPHSEPRNSARAIETAIGLAPLDMDMLVLQNPEVTHQGCVLHAMVGVITANPNAYVLTSCYDPDIRTWYETIDRKCGLHWCVGSLLSNWKPARHLPDWLMEGHAFEDNVLRNMMFESGLDFEWLSEGFCVLHHKRLQQKWTDGRKDRWDPVLVMKNQERYWQEYGHHYWSNTVKMGSGQ